MLTEKKKSIRQVYLFHSKAKAC